jgi:drug/metabolite transporter (DMT)-like permease
MTWRYNFAMLFLIVLMATRVVKVKFTATLLKKTLPATACYLAFMVLQAAGLVYATSAESGIAFAVIPIFAAAISAVFLKERPRGVQIAFMLLSAGSLIAMISFGASAYTLHLGGMIVLLLSGLIMAGSNVLMRFTRDMLAPTDIPSVIIICGFLLFNAVTLATGDITAYFSPLAHAGFAFSAAYLGVMCIFVTAVLMAYMTKKIAAYKATIFGNLSTAISIVAGILVLGEAVFWYHILFTALIICGVIGVSVTRAR